jgi:hypothetical protein
MLPHYFFWDEVYYSHYYGTETEALVKTTEALGRFVGFSTNVGHPMTFRVYSVRTKKLLVRSRIRLAKEGERNLRADMLPDPKTGEIDKTPAQVAALLSFADLGLRSKGTHTMQNRSKSRAEGNQLGSNDTRAENTNLEPDSTEQHDNAPPELSLTSPQDSRLKEGKHMLTIEPEDIVGQSFRLPPNVDGTSELAFIHEVLEEYTGDLMRDPTLIKFKYTVGEEVMEDLLSYNKAIEYITASELIEKPQWK